MKVIQIIQKPQLRGAEIFATQLSEHLLALGHVCKIVSLFRGDATLNFSGETIHLNRPQNRRLWDWIGWWKLAEIVETERPDIIQANAGDTLKFAVLSKQIFGWKCPIIFRNASTISQYIKSFWVLRFNSFLLGKTSCIISVCHFTMNDSIRLFPFLKSRMVTIPIGIELKEENDRRGVSAYLLHIGGFTFEKNHEGLVRIMGKIAQFNPNLELWLIGDGPLRQRVEKQVQESGLQGHVRFLGLQQTVIPYIESARALLLPSIIEGLPGVILEAMYSRTPVVAYDVGGISEVLRNRETGWLVKRGDEEGFAAAVGEVLMSTHLDLINENAHNLIENEYDNRVIAKRFLEVYERIIRQYD